MVIAAKPCTSVEKSFSCWLLAKLGRTGFPTVIQAAGPGDAHSLPHQALWPISGIAHAATLPFPRLPQPLPAPCLLPPVLLVPLPPKYTSMGLHGRALPMMDLGCQRRATGNSGSVTPPCDQPPPWWGLRVPAGRFGSSPFAATVAEFRLREKEGKGGLHRSWQARERDARGARAERAPREGCEIFLEHGWKNVPVTAQVLAASNRLGGGGGCSPWGRLADPCLSCLGTVAAPGPSMFPGGGLGVELEMA